jgi:hypothetical protein
MNVIAEAAAMVLSYEAKTRAGTESVRLFQQAIDTFKVLGGGRMERGREEGGGREGSHC